MADLIANPCPVCVSQAAFTKLLISTDENDFTDSGGVANRLYFLGEKLQKHTRKRDDDGITGTLDRLATRIHEAQSFVYGPIYFAMNAGDMDVLLPWMIGAINGSTYEPGTCPSERHFLIHRDYGIFKYTGCTVSGFAIDSRALRFREDSLADRVVLAINIIGEDRTVETDESYWPVGDEPALGATAAYNPYFFKNSTLTMRTSTDYSAYCKAVKLVANKNVSVRYRMASAPTQVCPGVREVDFVAGMDWNATTKDLFEQATNAPGSVKFANDESQTCSTTFNFSSLVAVDQDPTSPNKRSDVEWEVRNIAAAADSSSYDLTANNDSTV